MMYVVSGVGGLVIGVFSPDFLAALVGASIWGIGVPIVWNILDLK